MILATVTVAIVTLLFLLMKSSTIMKAEMMMRKRAHRKKGRKPSNSKMSFTKNIGGKIKRRRS